MRRTVIDRRRFTVKPGEAENTSHDDTDGNARDLDASPVSEFNIYEAAH